MPIYTGNLAERKSELQNTIRQLKSELQTIKVEGTLQTSTQRNHVRYYQRLPNGKRRYLGTEDMPTIQTLARKQYLTKCLETAQHEYRYICRTLDHYPQSGEDVYAKLSPERQAVITPFYQSKEDFIREWKEQPYERLPFREDDTGNYVTLNGEKVRSKGEEMIANQAYYDEVPYRLEPKLYLKNGRKVYPDFVLLNTRTGQEFIWEHFGMMDDEQYRNKTLAKISVYMESGYYPGINFIFTMETEKVHVSSFEIKEIFNTYLK